MLPLSSLETDTARDENAVGVLKDNNFFFGGGGLKYQRLRRFPGGDRLRNAEPLLRTEVTDRPRRCYCSQQLPNLHVLRNKETSEIFTAAVLPLVRLELGHRASCSPFPPSKHLIVPQHQAVVI
jgi:hypothetical protein